jgi:hypothetical protein
MREPGPDESLLYEDSFMLSAPLRAGLLALCLLCMACLASEVYGQAADPPEIGADAARRDLRILKRAFTDLHPGLTRYTTPAQIDAEFAAAEAAVAQGSSRAQMYLLATRLAAAVHCGHTWTNRLNQSEAVQQAVFGRADKLPLTLRWAEGRALVTGSVTPDVAAGAELLAVDGRPVAAIAAALLPYLRADGVGPDTEATKTAQLDSGVNGGAMDRLFPLLMPPTLRQREGRWRLSVRDTPAQPPREVEVAAVTQAARELALPAPGEAWTLKIEGDTAVLTLPTFGFWRSTFDPLAFLRQAFERIQDVPYLVIDQRRNEGGDDAIGRALLAYLLRAPYTQPAMHGESAYERVPYVLARWLDTWDFGFFDRTGQVTRGPGRNWLLPATPPRRIEPVAAPYRGRTAVLVGPQNTSAGYLLARDLKLSRAATLVGQATGGNLRGLNGGQLAWLTLPASGVAVDIPLLAAVTEGDVPDSGVQPDVRVVPRWADIAAGIDRELAEAQRVLRLQ